MGQGVHVGHSAHVTVSQGVHVLGVHVKGQVGHSPGGGHVVGQSCPEGAGY